MQYTPAELDSLRITYLGFARTAHEEGDDNTAAACRRKAARLEKHAAELRELIALRDALAN